jgi:hypothetical protein
VSVSPLNNVTGEKLALLVKKAQLKKQVAQGADEPQPDEYDSDIELLAGPKLKSYVVAWA